MWQWSIRKQILTSFGLILAVMLVMGGVALAYLQRIDNASESVESVSMPGVEHSSRLLLESLEGHLLMQRHIIARDKAELDGLEQQLRAQHVREDALLGSYEAT